jgi:hypothetical protein
MGRKTMIRPQAALTLGGHLDAPVFRSARRIAAAVGAAGLFAALAGCAATQSMPVVAFPSDTAPSVLNIPIAATPSASYTGYAPPLGQVTTQMSGLTTDATLAYPVIHVATVWLTFSVTITNHSTYTFQNLEPLVVLGLCTCNPKAASAPPSGFLETFDTGTNAWKAISYSQLAADNSFSYAKQVGTISLGSKASVTFQYRFSLGKTTKEPGLTAGAGSVNYYVMQLPAHTRVQVGTGPDASHLLTYPKVN